MPDRIQLRRTAGWRRPPGAVSVARPTIWGNPWAIGSPGRVRLAGRDWRLSGDLDAAGAVLAYRTWLCVGQRLSWRPLLLTAGETLDLLRARRDTILTHLPQLRGRDLACWCPPGCACHADVLIELANRETAP